jgi:hypothetical protein
LSPLPCTDWHLEFKQSATHWTQEGGLDIKVTNHLNVLLQLEMHVDIFAFPHFSIFTAPNYSQAQLKFYKFHSNVPRFGREGLEVMTSNEFMPVSWFIQIKNSSTNKLRITFISYIYIYI